MFHILAFINSVSPEHCPHEISLASFKYQLGTMFHDFNILPNPALNAALKKIDTSLPIACKPFPVVNQSKISLQSSSNDRDDSLAPHPPLCHNRTLTGPFAHHTVVLQYQEQLCGPCTSSTILHTNVYSTPTPVCRPFRQFPWSFS